MSEICDKVTSVLKRVADMKKILEICSYGLETAGEMQAISIIELYRELLDDVENKLSEIIEEMEKDDSSKETIIGIVE